MQTAASRRAFSFLASKIHPQLPLSPRESQQLLTLLTTSFRAHLDREHPVASAPNDSSPRTTQLGSRAGQPHTSRARVTSSHTSASQHIESILTNPLFAVKPQRRASDPAKLDAQEVLRDPLSWFLDQIAIGTANLHKAATCLQMLERNLTDTQREVSQKLNRGRRPASQITSWLTSSGIDTTREFIKFSNSQIFLKPLVNLLLKEGQDGTLWRWFARTPQLRIKETSLEEVEIQAFRKKLLWAMVTSKAQSEPHLDPAFTIFLRAVAMLDTPEYGLAKETLRPAGSQLVNYLLTNPQSAPSPALYESFLQSSQIWAVYPRRVQSLLWLHHPTRPSISPAVAYLNDPKGVSAEIPNASPKGRRELVHLCLGTAHQLLAERKFSDAQYVLELARDNFPDLVGPTSKESISDRESIKNVKRRREEKNLEMLDRLLPT